MVLIYNIHCKEMNNNMKNSYKFLFGFTLASTLFLSSCQQNNKPDYNVVIDSNQTHLKVTLDDSFKKEYQSGETLNLEGLHAYFNDQELSINETFYITNSQSFPKESKIDLTKAKLTTDNAAATKSFFVYHEEEDLVYVSDSIVLQVKNPNGGHTWVYYTVFGVVLVILALWQGLKIKSKNDKEKADKENKKKHKKNEGNIEEVKTDKTPSDSSEKK